MLLSVRLAASSSKFLKYLLVEERLPGKTSPKLLLGVKPLASLEIALVEAVWEEVAAVALVAVAHPMHRTVRKTYSQASTRWVALAKLPRKRQEWVDRQLVSNTKKEIQ